MVKVIGNIVENDCYGPKISIDWEDKAISSCIHFIYTC